MREIIEKGEVQWKFSWRSRRNAQGAREEDTQRSVARSDAQMQNSERPVKIVVSEREPEMFRMSI